MKNRISLAVFLLLMSLYSWAQIGGDYNPDNPSDPGNQAQEYTLTVKATPANGGSFNATSVNVAGGKTYSLRAYPSTDFAFVAWLCDGDTLSKSSSYTYTMPYHDVEIIGVFIYSPANPSDPNVGSKKYTLTMKATPSEGGSFNTASTKVSVGEVYNLRAYPNTDFAFVAWLCEGDTLSKSASYDYTMPSHNVDITGVFTYSPSSPSDPQEQALKYQLSLTAVPVNSGSFNISNERLAVGSNNSLRAYANTDFVFKHWMIGDSVLSTSSSMDFVMPPHSVQMVGVFEYNPASPANPASNHWNKETGEVIVDEFTPGNLSSAISSVISGSSSNDVQMIVVSGRLNSNDFGIANNYKNCSLLDLSRVTGVSEVPSYAFDYTNLETVYLPSTIEKIGTRAFAECSKLSSLTIYSSTPPTLESNVFQGVPSGLVVYVPAAAIAQYQDVEAWSSFSLLPIQEDICNITISLPEGANAADYAQMWLELTNVKSGQRMHYVMTDRQNYTFANIIRNTSWNVTLRNERGNIFGQINNVEVKDEDVSVVFSSLSKPQSVTLSVLTPNGQDVTTQTQVTWTDAQGHYLSQGVSLTGLPTGYQASYRIVLSQELAMAYSTPQPVDYVLIDGDNSITCQLNAIPRVKISGKVKDVSTGLPLTGAVISVSQTFGGQYSNTLNAKTDGNGVFALDIANVPTSVAFAASDYISQVVNCDSMLTGASEVILPDMLLKTITGATITLDFTYTSCDGETQNWYSDCQNVSYELFNVTKNKAISQYNVQYPSIVLMEEVTDGDVLKLTATSRTNAFMPVTVTGAIAEQKAQVTLPLVELGKIIASFATTDNASVVGSLYDAAGKLLNTYSYSEAVLTIDNLADGNYTLVSMGSSRLFNTIYDLRQLPQTGLAEGVDYVLNQVEVKSGQVSAISINEVPTLNESKLYYTGSNTSFSVNKPSIVAGNYLTMTGRIDFKDAYATNVSNVQMIVDLPESCQFVENSVMVGNSTSSYILNGHQITIPMVRYTDRVRFCVIPTLGGEYAPSAFVQFNLNGNTVKQPIGSANYTAKDLSISVPSTVAKKVVPISGTAVGVSDVEIYDNGVLIGQTTSKANGTWNTTCELNEPYNLSTHEIYAKVTTKQGVELTSENVSCVYDMNAIQVSMVKMYHNNPEMGKTYELTFDFLSPSSKEENYIYYIYNKKFSFTIDFTNNDTTKVSDVVLYVKTAKSGWHPLEATYDKKQNKWVAAGEFGNMYDGDLPVNVSVDFNMNVPIQMDREAIDNIFDMISDTQESINSLNEQFTTFINAVDDEADDESWLNAHIKVAELLGITISDIGEDEVVEEYNIQQLEEMRLQLEENHISLDSFMLENLYSDFTSVTEELKSRIQVFSCEGITELELIESGFEIFELTDGSVVYINADENVFEYYDFKNNIHLLVKSEDTPQVKAKLRAASSIDRILAYIKEIKALGDKASNLMNTISMALESVDRLTKNWYESTSKEYTKIFKQLQAIGRDAKKGIAAPEPLRSYLRFNLKLVGAEIKSIESVLKGVARISKGLSVISAIVNTAGMCSDLSEYISLYNTPKLKNCPLNQQKADEIKGRILGEALGTGSFYALNIAADVVSLGAIPSGITLIPETAGGSVGAVLLAIGKVALSIKMYDAHDKHVAEAQRNIRSDIRNLKCKEKGSDDNDNDDGGDHKSNNPDKKFGIDPSGYVYEGVVTNRVEGVTATIYYKENVEDMYGDSHENIVKWDATEYAQENPLFTDENGFYRWDVPQGLWQVKFEKEGYETTYSEWLPVPPPQLDVNIAIKQNRQPEVKAARAYEDAVEVEFDKYMMPELLTTENIMVMQNGTAVEGTVELLNEEVSCEGEEETFASKIRFNATKPFTEKEITLLVNNRVKSYAGIRMQDNYQQTFTIEQEIKQIVSDSVVTVGYGDASTLVVSVLPASASKGKMLTVKNSSPMILGVETEQVTVGDDGKAAIVISGDLPGTAALTFTIEGSDQKAMTIAYVEQKIIKIVATPKASIASGTVVEKGTTVTLTCETEGATIYYTLDGSCPCEDTAARKVYDGTPLVINESVTIKAMAVASDMYESDVAEFTYIVTVGTGVDNVTADGQIQIYPLPIRDKVNISAGGKLIRSVTVTSLNGVVMASVYDAATVVTLDASSLSEGIYVVNIVTVDGTYSRKILKVE